MQGLNPFTRSGDNSGRPAPVRHVASRPAPKPAVRKDPAPSRLAYRLNRMMLRPLIRRLVRIGIPAFLAALVAGIWLSDETRRANLQGGIDGLIDRIQHRDAFMVHGMEIKGASAVVEGGLRGLFEFRRVHHFLDALHGDLRQLDACGMGGNPRTGHGPHFFFHHDAGGDVDQPDAGKIARAVVAESGVGGG